MRIGLHKIMQNFIKKLAYWDGSIFLKKSVAVDNRSDAQNIFMKKIREYQSLIGISKETIFKLSSKNPGGKNSVSEYLLSQEASKEFELLNSLVNCKKSFEIIENSKAVTSQKEIINNYKGYLNKIIFKISSLMGNALTELLSRGDNDNFKKLSKMIEASKVANVDESALLQGSSLSKSDITKDLKFDWNQKFIEDIFCNLSDISKIKEISQERINQIDSQYISENLKDKMVDRVKEIVFDAISKIIKFKQDLERNINNAAKIREIGSNLIADIDSKKFPEEVRNKVLKEISKIVQEKMKELESKNVVKSSPLQTDLQKAFPSIAEGLFPTNNVENIFKQKDLFKTF